jgi:hypothetical protein
MSLVNVKEVNHHAHKSIYQHQLVQSNQRQHQRSQRPWSHKSMPTSMCSFNVKEAKVEIKEVNTKEININIKAYGHKSTPT